VVAFKLRASLHDEVLKPVVVVIVEVHVNLALEYVIFEEVPTLKALVSQVF
jgi:hypothetical protein